MNDLPSKNAKEFEMLQFNFSDNLYPNARKLRDKHARELRKQGWEIRCGKQFDYGFGKGNVYWLAAYRRRKK